MSETGRSMVLKKRRASLTVEAAFVVPLCLWVFLVIFQMGLYRCQVSYYTMAAWESAVYALREDQGSTTLASERFGLRKETSPFPGSNVTAKAAGGKNTIGLTVTGETPGIWRSQAMNYRVSVQRKVCDPVTALRRIKEIKEIIKE